MNFAVVNFIFYFRIDPHDYWIVATTTLPFSISTQIRSVRTSSGYPKKDSPSIEMSLKIRLLYSATSCALDLLRPINSSAVAILPQIIINLLTCSIYKNNGFRAKLNNKDVLDMRTNFALGMSVSDISKLYLNVSIRTIYRIIMRETWKNI
jgi:hypothetical protein